LLVASTRYGDEAGGQSELVALQALSLERVLVAMATNERVASFLRNYPERDGAIEALEDDIARQGRELLADLRTVTRERSAAAVRARAIRDQYLIGSQGS
jgi:hypothetical protein